LQFTRAKIIRRRTGSISDKRLFSDPATDIALNLSFRGVIELPAGGRENLYPIVFVWIMRCAYNNSCVGRYCFRQKGYTRSGNYARGFANCPACPCARDDSGFKPRSGLASIPADHYTRSAAAFFVSKTLGKRPRRCENGLGIKRKLAGRPPHTICSEKSLHLLNIHFHRFKTSTSSRGDGDAFNNCWLRCFNRLLFWTGG
jgi:hypothetical protein